MKYQNYNGFTIAEVLTALGIIGILVVTMLSLNNFSDNHYKIATTKLSQVDSALKTWGKAISKSNETGLGVNAVISDQNSLNDSLLSYFNSKDSGIAVETSKISSNDTIKDAQLIKLDNGVTLKAKFKNSLDETSNDGYVKDVFCTDESPCAVIIASTVTKVSGQDKELTEEYALFANGVKSVDSMYEGWEKTPIVTGPCVSDTSKVCSYICDNEPCNSDYCKVKGNCTTDNDVTELCPTNDCGFIYTKPESGYACAGTNQTGAIVVKQRAVGLYGSETYTEDQCCAAPKVFEKYEGQNKICVCPDTFTPQKGYIKSDESATCETPCLPGSYEKDGVCNLCVVGHYCLEEAMTDSVICPKGYYCPNNVKDDKDKNKYNNAKYVYETDKNGDTSLVKVKDGGLINKVICPKGYYCPEVGATDKTICPKGHYCPEEGLVEPIKCPAGTYSAQEGATDVSACLPCPRNYYCPTAGTVSPIVCAVGTWSDEGALFCQGCPAGSYYDTKLKKCELCPAGSYQDKSGSTSCIACPVGNYCPEKGLIQPKACICGTYQPEAGKTVCLDVLPGQYASNNNSNEFVSQAATNVRNCEDGYACAGKCQAPVLCKAGYYSANDKGNPQSVKATQCAICPPGYKCPKDNPSDEDSITHRYACEPGTYQPQSGQTACIPCEIGTYSNTVARKTACDACPAGMHGNNTLGLTECVKCPAGTWSDKKGNKDANACTWCQPGTYSTAEGQTSVNTCVKCPIRTYTVAEYSVAPASKDFCIPCPTGTYSVVEGAVDKVGDGAGVCKFCPVGKYFNSEVEETYTSVDEICTCCPSNTYGVQNASKAPSTISSSYDKSKYPYCEACPFGTAFPGTCAASVGLCVACKDGEKTNSDGTCSKCEAGYYSQVSPDNPNVKICVPCPAGTSTNGVAGGTSPDVCKPCAQDTYAPNQGMAKCLDCDKQTYANGTGNTSCTACADYGSVYMMTQGHNHATTLAALLNNFTCIPSSQITAKEKAYSNGEGRQNLYIISDKGFLIDYIDTHNSIVNSVKDRGGNYGVGKLHPENGNYEYSTVGRKGYIPNGFCNGHGSSVVGGTLKTIRNRCEYDVNYTFKVQSPLVFDIQGDGLVFTSVKDGVQFDITGNGVEQTAWTTNMENKGFDDAFLCIASHDNPELKYVENKGRNFKHAEDNSDGDKKQNFHNEYLNDKTTPMVYEGKVLNVQIQSGKQLFGDQNGEKTGFDELTKYDDNNDGTIDAQDAIFDNLLLWSDLNKNGRVDYYVLNCDVSLIKGFGNILTGQSYCSCSYDTSNDNCYTPELKTLKDVGITSISTEYSTEFNEDGLTIKTDEHGNVIGIVGGFMMDIWDAATGAVKSVVRTIVDVFFKTLNG